MTQLVWFRNDLRAADNPALAAACQSAAQSSGEPIEACFIVTTKQWLSHDWSAAKVHLMLDHADALAQELAKLGIALSFLRAADFEQSLDTLETFCREHKISQVHFNEEYGVSERRRDKALKLRLDALGIKVSKYRDQAAVPVGEVLTQQNGPYAVFTPFSRRWRSWQEEQQPALLAVPKKVGEALAGASVKNSSGVILKKEVDALFGEAPPALVATGENAAHDALQNFLQERAGGYKRDRDFPAIEGTSKLSPYLAIGALSGRQCVQAAWQLKQSMGSSFGNAANAEEGFFTWVTELAWRDFYIHILYHYPRVSMHRAFKPETEALRWNTADEHFEAWKNGRTGIPMVDAAMRQLNATGWMHNRLRMVAAMFLAKNLFIDWRRGEAYFMSKLADGYLSSNNGGWQWSASTGTDASPYFRVFNPMTQGERFDTDGEFIRHWVPELAKLDSKRIHNPGKGGVIPGGYPRPIVDLKESRKEAIARFQALRD
jgi:deoxyribodipyrimidine photo-lyase